MQCLPADLFAVQTRNEKRPSTVHCQVWIIIPNIVEVVFLKQKDHPALMKQDQPLSRVQPARWSLGWGEFLLSHLVGKGEAFPDSSDSQITRGSVWIISLSKFSGRTELHCLSFGITHTHTHPCTHAHIQTSTCQFLCAYHLIKASPYSLCSTENCSSPLITSPSSQSNVLVVFSKHAVSCAARFLRVNTCMFDILYPLIALL